MLERLPPPLDDTWEIECDICGSEIQLEILTFFDMISELKNLGWKIFKRVGNWNHKCPICVGES